MAKLYFYYAAMNAGKTTIFLQSAYNYNERGMDTLLFIPAIDNRYAVGMIKSRIGLEANAFAFDDQFDFFEYVALQIEQNPNIRCIMVDEAHFLTKAQVTQLGKITLELDRPVLTYGLRTDFMGELFEGSQYLLAWAEKLVEIKTICHCGKKATMNLRVDESGRAVRAGEQVEIGGNERYIAVCRKHYALGIGKWNTTQQEETSK